MSGTITISPTLIAAPFAADSYTGASGINNAGTIIVNSQNLSYEEYDGTYQRLYAPNYFGNVQFHAAGINNEGVIAGYFEGNGTEVGVIDDQGQFTTLSVDHEATELTAINDFGDAVGNFTTGSFIDQNGTITLLRPPSDFSSVYAEGINNAGEIVGYYGSGVKSGFTDINGTFTTVDIPGSENTLLYGINNEGEIAGGDFDAASGTVHPFIDTNGSFTSVDLQGFTLGGALTAINDDGQVAGFENFTSYTEAFTAEVTCFCSGTRILTARGEVAVEALKIGDRVRTLHAGMQPVKWIGTRTYLAPFCNHAKILPIRIAAHAIADGVPARDLFVSPGHAIYVDGVLIHAARLLNGVTITQAQSAPEISYFHIELENHEIILAENCPAETYRGECFRQQFQNAATFSARYPGARAPENFAAPVVMHGARLAAILNRLRARAGILPRTRGPLTGYIDQLTPTSISGWALDLARPDEPVILDVMMGNSRLGRTIANIPRPDVADAGFGAGCHGFEFVLPPGISGAMTVRRAADCAPLPVAAAQQAVAFL